MNAMNKAKEFLENEAERMTKQNTDSYTLAITTYALSLVNSPKRFNALSELEALAVKRGEINCAVKGDQYLLLL